MNIDNKALEKNYRIKLFIFFIVLFVIFVSSYLILQSTNVTDYIKNLIINEIELASKQKVNIKKISVNPFPFFIEAKDVEIINPENKEIMSVKKVKGYIGGFNKLLKKRIKINRLVIYEPNIRTHEAELQEIARNIDEYLKKQRKDVFKADFKVVEILKGDADILVNETVFNVRGINGEFVIGEEDKIKANIKNVNIKSDEIPDLNFSLDTDLILKKESLKIKSLKILSSGSTIRGEGFYSEKENIIKTSIDILFNTIKSVFNLRQRGDGVVKAKGEVRFSDIKTILSDNGWKNIFLDLKLNGDFYLETLMELLKVNEKLNGSINFDGMLSGYLNNLIGDADARLKNGNLFGVDVEYLRCKVLYENEKMYFRNAEARVYNGFAQADASITLPVVNYYTFRVNFKSADSKPLLKLIGWEPDIPDGKVEGELSTAGSYFNPDGWFVYRSIKKNWKPSTKVKGLNNNVLSRIAGIRGKFKIHEPILTLSDLWIDTIDSKLFVYGDIDLDKRTLNLKSSLYCNNLYDLSYPYYLKLKGNLKFTGDIKGQYEDPTISGFAEFRDINIEGYPVNNAYTAFSYNKRLLDIKKLVLHSVNEEHIISGNISFPRAKEIFDISYPEYNLKLSLLNADFKNISNIFYKGLNVSGVLNANLSVKGKNDIPDISGNLSIKNAFIYKVPFDSIATLITYKNNELSFNDLKFVKANSILTGKGSFFINEKKFDYWISGKNVNLKDFKLNFPDIDTSMDVTSEGRGTFDNPLIKINANLNSINYKGYRISQSTILATIENRVALFNANIFENNLVIRGRANLDSKLTWDAEALLNRGKYNFLIAHILKEVPEDLQLNLEGRIFLNGDKEHINSLATLKHLTLTLYGQTFNCVEDIELSLQDRKLIFKPFNLRSGVTSFKLSGGVEIGKEYDILINGTSSLSPLKGLSKKIGYLKGDTDFVFSITGKWDRPKIDGGMNITNASFGLKEYPYYLSSINGYIYMDEDKIVVQRLNGKFGGGDVRLTGSANLKAFNINKFYLDVDLNNISLPIAEDINVNVGGSLVYKGDKNKQQITGDIKINRAKFRRMVEWRTWLITKKHVEIPKTEISAFEKAELNIRIMGSENIYIDNNIARAPVNIRGDMIVKGTLNNPVIFGRLESTEGYVYFRNNEFRVIYATADFVDPNFIKPIIHLNAETLVKGYNIKLNLEGQLDHFTLTLSSDPYLDEVDILSLLTVGQLGKQLKGLEGGIGAGEATSFLTGKIQDVIEERLRAITGLDRFQVEPSVSTITGTVSPKVTVSKRFISDKLFVTYSNLLGSTEEQVIKIEYQLGRNVSLIGVRDERGSMGGDIKFRFEFK